ncbi:MAG: response regulator transcription factor [bacterium]
MKVFLVFDSEIIRRWLRMLVFHCPAAEIIGEAHDPIRALNAIRALKPDVVIMDSRNKRRLGIDVLLSMRELKPDPKVIMLTNKLYFRYEGNGAGTKADFLVDTFSERHKLPEILNACVRDGSTTVQQGC